jgi:hypothetical protein
VARFNSFLPHQFSSNSSDSIVSSPTPCPADDRRCRPRQLVDSGFFERTPLFFCSVWTRLGPSGEHPFLSGRHASCTPFCFAASPSETTPPAISQQIDVGSYVPSTLRRRRHRQALHSTQHTIPTLCRLSFARIDSIVDALSAASPIWTSW